MGNLLGSTQSTASGDDPAATACTLKRTSDQPSDSLVESHVLRECTSLFEGAGPEGDKWETVFENGDRLKVWRRQHPNKPSAFEYALRGKTPHSPEVFFSTAYEDLVFRRKWDESCGDAQVLSFCRNTAIETLYWVTKYPWPVAERDYIFHRVLSKNVNTGAFHGVSWVGEKAPYLDDKHTNWELKIEENEVNEKAKRANSSRVRVTDYATTMLVVPTADGGAMWALRVLDDPKVSFIPPQVINWVVSKTLPNSADKLDRACESRIKS